MLLAMIKAYTQVEVTNKMQSQFYNHYISSKVLTEKWDSTVLPFPYGCGDPIFPSVWEALANICYILV